MLQGIHLRFQPVLLGKSRIGELRVVVPATGTTSVAITIRLTITLALPVKVPDEVSTGAKTDERHSRPRANAAPRVRTHAAFGKSRHRGVHRSSCGPAAASFLDAGGTNPGRRPTDTGRETDRGLPKATSEQTQALRTIRTSTDSERHANLLSFRAPHLGFRLGRCVRASEGSALSSKQRSQTTEQTMRTRRATRPQLALLVRQMIAQ